MRMNYVNFKDQKMSVYSKNNKYDTTILFLHGLNSNSSFIDNLLEYDNKFNIVSVNFPGSKYAPDIDPEDIILDDWIELAKAVLKGIKSKHIHILAHSMAGGVAVELAKDPRVEKVFMLATINPTMTENKSYKLLHNVIGPQTGKPSMFGKLFVWGAKFFKKGKRLIDSFSRKGKWYNLLDKYILQPSFMEKLDKQYREVTKKLIFIIGDKDSIIGTDNFINYANELNCPAVKIGETHSPIKVAGKQMSNFLNMLVISKKVHWPFNKFITFSKNIINVGVSNDADDEDAVEEILDQLNKNGEIELEKQ
ncbi:alpha/beta hydrolase [Mycoplasmopsis agalactiae]|uniref:Esterase/lipase n=2 Tax=Mycoplasmopsis agalactiae TaxID=2110 RepID=A5IZA3_MYCAP|nr:alpha/beta hydrolase [Mycoplasmopsis agalactiae]CAL59362.1 Esterase/lipase [Mycoplasmopsis agalactiae PG2]MCE6079158.1 alpha/beta hydrolase [Mycoplasmopsis agalactiae]MCE6095556.1 alpha/beta hydrolase [Mycoplasmopsis agalactiae]MCE6114802.1 alpha/beta hydrolase [Mycoplasmopsis agalactiae]